MERADALVYGLFSLVVVSPNINLFDKQLQNGSVWWYRVFGCGGVESEQHLQVGDEILMQGHSQVTF